LARFRSRGQRRRRGLSLAHNLLLEQFDIIERPDERQVHWIFRHRLPEVPPSTIIEFVDDRKCLFHCSAMAQAARNAKADRYVLETRGLTRQFDGFFAVRNVNFQLGRNSVHAVIGPNGAGKTTLFNLLTKHLAPTAGVILHDGEDVTHLGMPAMAKRGVVRSFQISAVFAGLTVHENVEVALLRRGGLAWSFLGRISKQSGVTERAAGLLSRFGLAEQASTMAGNLSYGCKRVLELATTLALDPEVLLLDEPMAGLGREDIGRITQLIREARQGRTVLLVEHNMSVVAELADKITVMVRGEILAEGRYAEVAAHPDVITAYTGRAHG
jgi:branched-chain amino acid transport system ATP-binding protein